MSIDIEAHPEQRLETAAWCGAEPARRRQVFRARIGPRQAGRTQAGLQNKPERRLDTRVIDDQDENDARRSQMT